jgi:hypothetical protein
VVSWLVGAGAGARARACARGTVKRIRTADQDQCQHSPYYLITKVPYYLITLFPMPGVCPVASENLRCGRLFHRNLARLARKGSKLGL